MTDTEREPIEAGADICDAFAPFVYGGRVDHFTVIAPGAWRGTTWPCPGQQPLRGPDGADIGRVTCTCLCHHGGPAHELPKNANRTTVHPTDVRSASCTTS